MRTMLIINPSTDPASGTINGGAHWLVAPDLEAEELRRRLVACITEGTAAEIPVVFPGSEGGSSLLVLGRSVLLTAAVVSLPEAPVDDRNDGPPQSGA
jgi:hypothetical protein